MRLLLIIPFIFLYSYAYGDVDIINNDFNCYDYPCYASIDISIDTNKIRLFDDNLPLSNLDDTLYKGDSYQYDSNITFIFDNPDGYRVRIVDVDMVYDGFEIINNRDYKGLIYNGIVKTPNNIDYSKYEIKARIIFEVPYRYKHTHTYCITQDDGSSKCYSYTHIHTSYTTSTKMITIDTFDVVKHEPVIRVLEWLALLRGNNTSDIATSKQANIALHYLNDNPLRRVVIDKFDYRLYAYNYTDAIDYYEDNKEPIYYDKELEFIAEDIYLDNTCYNANDKIVIDKVGYCNIIIDYEPISIDELMDKILLTLKINATTYEHLDNNELFNTTIIYPDDILTNTLKIHFANKQAIFTSNIRNDTLQDFLYRLYKKIIYDRYNVDDNLALIPIQLDHHYTEKVNGNTRMLRPSYFIENLLIESTPYSINAYYDNMSRPKFMDYDLCLWENVKIIACKNLSYPLVSDTNIAVIIGEFDASSIIRLEGNNLLIEPYIVYDNQTYNLIGVEYYLDNKKLDKLNVKLDEGNHIFEVNSIFNGYGSYQFNIVKQDDSYRPDIEYAIFIGFIIAMMIALIPKIVRLFSSLME